MEGPHMWSTPSGDKPLGLWDESKATAQFQGAQHFTGGSMPEDGHVPFDTAPRVSPGSPASFFGQPTQGDHLGTNYIQ